MQSKDKEKDIQELLDKYKNQFGKISSECHHNFTHGGIFNEYLVLLGKEEILKQIVEDLEKLLK